MIREATVDDIREIHNIRMSVKENVLNNPLLVTDADYINYLMVEGKGWVYMLDNEIAGFAIVNTRENNIWALFVHPAHERKGIGKKLQHAMLDWFFTNSNETLWLGTAPNTRAENFYKKSGWRNLGLRENGEIKFEMTYPNWMKNKSIVTPRLILRQLSINDEKEIFILRSDEELLKFLDIPKASSLDDAHIFINKINNGIEKGEWFYWAITLNNHDRLIGTICLWNFSKDRTQAEIGYQLLKEYQGKGYMQEALQKILNFAFNKVKLKSIQAELSPRNLKSLKILERNNFTKKAFQIKQPEKESHDSVVYSLESTNR